MKLLPETEVTWVLLDNDYRDVVDTEKQTLEIKKQVEKAISLKTAKAKKSEYGDCAKYVTFITTDKKGNETDGTVKAVLNEDVINKSLKLAGYNLLVSFETKMSATEIYSAYRNLWRIEESFTIMKSQLGSVQSIKK